MDGIRAGDGGLESLSSRFLNSTTAAIWRKDIIRSEAVYIGRTTSHLQGILKFSPRSLISSFQQTLESPSCRAQWLLGLTYSATWCIPGTVDNDLYGADVVG